MKKHISLAAFWFTLSFQQAALLTIVIPATVARLTHAGHIVFLSQLITLGDFIAMVTLPLIGALSDRVRAKGGQRRQMIVLGSAANVLGLAVGGSTLHVWVFACGFLFAILGLSAAGASFQAIMPELVRPAEWGKASGYIGVATLLGNALGLALTGFLPIFAAYVAMILVTIVGALYTFFGIHESPSSAMLFNVRPRQKPTAFYWVFIARFLVMFGQTLLMTYVLYYFQDVLHTPRPTASTAELSLLALVGAALSSFVVGSLSDRLHRAHIVAVATLPMAVATIAFAYTSSVAWMLAFAVLYGAGYGAFLSVDWALALDTMPSLENIARQLGIWGIAATLPTVIAPAVGGFMLHRPVPLAHSYFYLFWLAGLTILAGAVVVWFAGGIQEDSWFTVILSLTVASVLCLVVTLRCRVRLTGHLPKQGALLIVSNHVHDLDGAFIPPRLYLRGNWRYPIYTVASQRLFESGFLAVRSPRWLKGWMRSFNAGPILRLIGIRPIEDTPRTRPFYSWASEIRRMQGNLPLEEVFEHTFLHQVGAKGLYLSHLYQPRWLHLANQPVSLRAIQEPIRQQLRSKVRDRINEQISSVCRLLEQKRKVFVTPEGRLTPDGLIGLFRFVLEPLRDKADAVFLSAVAYDPLCPGRLGIDASLVSYTHTVDLTTALAAIRPINASHTIAHALAVLGGKGTEQEVVKQAIAELAHLPSGVHLAFKLQRDREKILTRVFRRLVQLQWLEQVESHVDVKATTLSWESRYQVATPWKDKRFSHVKDLYSYLINQWEETVTAHRQLERFDKKTHVDVN
ncbi:MFS transporter [Alicyclobacillus tolerans]|uniref:Major Facilitator Superfamily protein n=1 Tax=Alicyclobacillus tolerans TaxID=90970 RepID=A0A1M6NN00_9BACL|nr:MFS transporter [Alicyclobacillus montanus]SHJ96942.1 Major Facilitator Superfamily protein [Alicyclobacillus montanus]